MYGAVIGDIVGSTYKLHNVKSDDFELVPQGSSFKDDTVLSVAVVEKLLNERLAMVDSKEYKNAG